MEHVADQDGIFITTAGVCEFFIHEFVVIGPCRSGSVGASIRSDVVFILILCNADSFRLIFDDDRRSQGNCCLLIVIALYNEIDRHRWDATKG